MLGRVIYERGRGKTRLEGERIGPLAVKAVTLFDPPGQPFWRVRGRVHRMERLLLRAGVSRVILPVGFPYEAELRSLRPVDPLPLYRAHADLLALGALAEMGLAAEDSVVALSGLRVSPELARAAERLCPVVRGVALRVEEGGAVWAERLFQRYGMPEFPPERADLTVAFGPSKKEWGRVLPLYRPEFRSLGIRLRAEGWELPARWADGLLTALWEQGRLNRGAMRAGFSMPLDKWGQSTYNSIE